MIEFIKISDTRDSTFTEAMEIYSSSFPPSERHPVEVISQRVGQGLNELYLGRLRTEVVFMALLWPLKDTDFVLLDYMATKNRHQNEGIGTAFMQKMRDSLVRNQKHLIIEVEDLEHGINIKQRKRRVSFYKRIGAKELKSVRYILPGLDGGDPTEMVLMVFPEYSGGIVEGEVIQKLVIRIYHELYGRDRNDVLLNSFINTIGGRIELV